MTVTASGLLSATSAPVWWGLLAAVLVLVSLTWWLIARHRARLPRSQLQRAADDMLTGLLVPHTESGEIHIEYAVLTSKGVMVVEFRDVAGYVFGSENMRDWTVLGRNGRSTFSNPLPMLHDRVAAVKRLIPDVPVRGCVAFGKNANFSKGFPPHVTLLETLLNDLAAERGIEDDAQGIALRHAWTTLQKQAQRSMV